MHLLVELQMIEMHGTGVRMLNTNVYRSTNFVGRTRGRRQGTFQQRNVVSDVRETWNRKVSSLFFPMFKGFT